MMTFLHECNHCGALEERLFIDHYTGIELCIACLGPIIDRITNSPSEGDNLFDLLNGENDEPA